MFYILRFRKIYKSLFIFVLMNKKTEKRNTHPVQQIENNIYLVQDSIVIILIFVILTFS